MTEKKEDKIFQEIEIIEKKVSTEVEKGNTELKIFDPFTDGVESIDNYLTEEFSIIRNYLAENDKKEIILNDLTDQDLKNIRKARSGIRKVAGIIKDSRLSITRKLDDVKKTFISKENEIAKKLNIWDNEMKIFLDDKKRFEELKIVKELLPTWKEKLKKISIEKTDDELLEFNEKSFQEYILEETEKYLDKVEKERQEKERIAEIERKAKEEAERRIKEAEEKAKEKIKEVEEKVEKKIEEVTGKKPVEKIEVKKEDSPLVVFLKENGVKSEDMKSGKYIVKDIGNEYQLYKLIATKKK